MYTSTNGMGTNMKDLVHRIRICPICEGPKVNPRKLLCLHSFCQDCIGAHIDSCIGQSSYPCPVCRHDTPFIDSSEKKGTFAALRRDVVNEVLWESFEYNRFTPGNIKYKKFCNKHDYTPVERFCYKCCEFMCWRCSSKHLWCPRTYISDQDEIYSKASREMDKVIVYTADVVETLNSFREVMKTKVESMHSEKGRKEAQLTEYFTDLREKVKRNLDYQEQQTNQRIDEVSNRKQENVITKESRWKSIQPNLQLKLELLKFLLSDESNKFHIENKETLYKLCNELEEQINEAYEEVGQFDESDDFNAMIYFSTDFERRLQQSNLVHVELIESCQPNQSAVVSNNGEEQDHHGDDKVKDKDDINEEPMLSSMANSCEKSENPKSLHEDEVAQMRRILRRMSFTRQRVMPSAPPMRSPEGIGKVEVIEPQPGSASDATQDRLKNVTFRFESKINSFNDKRTPGPVGMAHAGLGAFVVVDRWNKSIKLVDIKQNKVLVDNFSLESEPWDVTCLSGNIYMVTCPDKREFVRLHYTIFRKIRYNGRTKVRMGYTGLAYLKSDNKYICSVCPPFGNPQIDVINTLGDILQTVKRGQGNEHLFSYPRCLTVSASGFILVLDMNIKKISFLRYDDISTTVIGEFKGSDELSEPESATIMPGTDFAIVVFKSGTLVVFSNTGQIVDVFYGKITHPIPKCIAMDPAPPPSSDYVPVLCIGHMDGTITCYDA